MLQTHLLSALKQHMRLCVCSCVLCVSTWNVVSEADSGESDDHKVERLQKGPFLHFLKHDSWHGEEDQTTNQDGENG